MNNRALEFVFKLKTSPDGKTISRLGRVLLTVIAACYDEERGSASVPVFYIQVLFQCVPALAITYITQLEKAGLIAIVEEAPEHFICSLVDLPPLAEVPSADDLWPPVGPEGEQPTQEGKPHEQNVQNAPRSKAEADAPPAPRHPQRV